MSSTDEFHADVMSERWNPVVAHRVPCHPVQMAKKATRRERVNRTGGAARRTDATDRVSDPDVTTIINYLEYETPRSIDQIAGKCRLPRAYLRALLGDLAAADRIEYSGDFENVWLAGGGNDA